MNWADKTILILFLAAILTWQALHQAKLFKQNKTISHFWKAVAYCGAVALATIPFIVAFGWWYLLKVPVIGLLERMAIFNPILNIARGKPIYYLGTETPNESITDEVEKEIDEFFKLSNTEMIIVAIFLVGLFITSVIFIK